MPRPLAPKGGNDRIYTPPDLAKAIVEHFNPSGMLLDPCRGKGAFYEALLPYATNGFVEFYELDEGADFLDSRQEPVCWTITNPPWSKFRAFLKKSMECSTNVVFLCLVNAFFMKARRQDMADENFGIKEILFVPTPPKPWPQAGFALGAVHIQRGAKEDSIKFSYLK
jgi:hypothetical protein